MYLSDFFCSMKLLNQLHSWHSWEYYIFRMPRSEIIENSLLYKVKNNFSTIGSRSGFGPEINSESRLWYVNLRGFFLHPMKGGHCMEKIETITEGSWNRILMQLSVTKTNDAWKVQILYLWSSKKYSYHDRVPLK